MLADPVDETVIEFDAVSELDKLRVEANIELLGARELDF